MSVTPKRLGQGQIGADYTVLYTVPAPPTIAGVVRAIRMVNNDASERTLEMHLVPNGGSPSEGTLILPAGTSLAAKSVLYDDGVLTLESGDSIQGKADVGAKITVTISGAEVT